MRNTLPKGGSAPLLYHLHNIDHAHKHHRHLQKHFMGSIMLHIQNISFINKSQFNTIFERLILLGLFHSL